MAIAGGVYVATTPYVHELMGSANLSSKTGANDARWVTGRTLPGAGRT